MFTIKTTTTTTTKQKSFENADWSIGLTGDGRIRLTCSTPETFLCSLTLNYAGACNLRDKLTAIVEVLKKDLEKEAPCKKK